MRGLKLIKVYAFMQTLPQGLNLLLLLLMGLIISTQNVPVYAMFGCFVLTGIIGWIIIKYAFKNKIKPNDKIHPISVQEIMVISLPMFMTATMNFFIGQTGVIMLGMFRSEAEVGYYAVAIKLSTLTAFILTAINSMVAPKFSELFYTGQIEELLRIAKKSTKLIFWVTAPILLCLMLIGKPLILSLFGSDFTIAYWAMFYLVLGQFFNSISGSTGIFMNMTGHQKIYRNIMITTAILNVILNYVLIPAIGLYGAALAGMICLVFWNVTTLIYIKIKYGKTIGYVPLFNLITKKI